MATKNRLCDINLRGTLGKRNGRGSKGRKKGWQADAEEEVLAKGLKMLQKILHRGEERRDRENVSRGR